MFELRFESLVNQFCRLNAKPQSRRGAKLQDGREHSFLYVQTVLGLVDRCILRTIQNAIRYNNVPSHWKAMHEPSVIRQTHNILIDTPVLVLLTKLYVFFASTVVMLAAPALRINNSRVFASFTLILNYSHFAAARF